MNQDKKRLISLVIILLVIVLVGSTVFFSKLKVTDEGIKNSGMYGVDLKYSDIEEVKLQEELPKNLIRSNGINLGSIYIGKFKSMDSEKLKLFVYSSKGPFIYIKPKSKDYNYIIINFKQKQETENVFKQISDKIK
ncbi:PH domain-containing protein [Desnuesiella massiliensis]|uniref:PH domain-containing protein n=1 Tax=Desnuesiella massiliensis TaxID=1650662 RepID=UPI0006E15FF5|nr:PH domain-containing protein [Desnuesiella massiliensis]